MGRDYWRKRPTWWTGETGRALRRYPAVARETGDYLISAPTATCYGLYYLPILTIVNDTGRQRKQIEDAMVVLHDLAFAYYDPINEFVWVREMCREQMCPLPLKTGDWQIGAANKWYRSCPANLFLGPWFDRYAELLRIDGQRRDWRPQGQQMLFPTEHTLPEGANTTPLLSTTSTDHRITTVQGQRFDQFWSVWPSTRRIGRQEARQEWNKIKPDEALTAVICASVERHKRSAQWLKSGGQYIVHPSRYLKHRRWEDLVEGAHLSESTVEAGRAIADFLRGKDEDP